MRPARCAIGSESVGFCGVRRSSAIGEASTVGSHRVTLRGFAESVLVTVQQPGLIHPSMFALHVSHPPWRVSVERAAQAWGNLCPLLGAFVTTSLRRWVMVALSELGSSRPVDRYIAVADPAVSAGDGVTPSGADCIIGSSRVVVTAGVDTSVTSCQTT